MPDKIIEVDIESEEYKKQLNTYQEYISTYVNGFVTKLFSDGIINEVNANTLKKYFANPDQFQKEIENLAEYFYISTAEVHMLYELIESLPTLNYKIESFDKNKSTDKNIGLINKSLHKIKHKRFTRDLLKQVATAGTVVGMWLGDKNKLYPYIFDDLQNVFPAYRKNGEWVCIVDMNWFTDMTEFNRKMQFDNLKPYITEGDFQKYKSNTTKYQYVELPQERTFTINTGTLKRNQGLGTSWVTSGLYDVLHKKKLKDVESSIANKIINAVAVLTVGTDKMNGEYTNLKLSKPVKQKIHSGVKAALEKNNADGVTVVTIPDFANIAFPDVKTDGLNGKFEDVNSDIRGAYGLSGAVLDGSGTNHASAKISIDALYKRIGVMLENIEQEVYQRLLNLTLPKTQSDNFYMKYDKEAPLTLKEKVDILTKLNDKGWSVKHLVDQLPDITWESFLEQTIYETDTLKLQERIKPYQSSHTTSNKDDMGAPEVDSDNENTVKSKTSDGNSLPD
ncbi:hypothetical protein [Lederbergia lenta]|uniref:hypothetical protein n=1 Tax=Lederbergia lenta TaxID=1467 RepID=UPI00204071DB|nr:hypothetical protein [Lederbergia lenta]MCM3110027.1 hypothetical protein [Lederbergia lenta]